MPILKWEQIFSFNGTATVPSNFPRGSTPGDSANADTLALGANTLVNNFPLQENAIISGFAQCDRACTITILQGNRLGSFSVVDSISVPATALVSNVLPEGQGTKIPPIRVLGPWCKVVVTTVGGTTKSFICEIRASEQA